MNRTARQRREHGTTLVLTVITITLLTLVAAFTLRRVAPRFRMAHQTAAWQEARLAAEAGVDAAMGDLLRNTTGPVPGAWKGWKQDQGGGLIGPVLSTTLETVKSILSLLLGGGGSGGTVTVSEPIFLDNLKVSAGGAIPTEVDVQLWALGITGNPRTRWFRIRSMATCALPAPGYPAPDRLDGPLRRFSLREVRPQLRKDDVGAPMSIRPPSASRTIEVLVEPILAFELAILTDRSLSLGTTGRWAVDSYDSRDPLKSNPDGTYPGQSSPKVQENGHIASNGGRPADSLYGPLISANGARVRGTVATNGGDDPETATHENVAGALALDPARVRDDFYREMKPLARPSTENARPKPLLGGPFSAGSESSPSRYLITGQLGAFSVEGPGVVIIMVDGDLDVGNGGITIPPDVTAYLYVRGNIDFHGNAINTGVGSSHRPGQLQIFGEESGLQLRTLRAYGNAAVCAAFYGPTYEVRLEDNVDWCGAIGARSFEMSGGGTGGFHYDEALATAGPPISFRIARYIEDVRQ
ncbi:MAG: hypothetical protein QOE70_6711 [Chthoniobacter sp.]|nr:hypothetical protein [Chthoniobacter sp.]